MCIKLCKGQRQQHLIISNPFPSVTVNSLSSDLCLYPPTPLFAAEFLLFPSSDLHPHSPAAVLHLQAPSSARERDMTTEHQTLWCCSRCLNRLALRWLTTTTYKHSQFTSAALHMLLVHRLPACSTSCSFTALPFSHKYAHTQRHTELGWQSLAVLHQPEPWH